MRVCVCRVYVRVCVTSACWCLSQAVLSAACMASARSSAQAPLPHVLPCCLVMPCAPGQASNPATDCGKALHLNAGLATHTLIKTLPLSLTLPRP